MIKKVLIFKFSLASLLFCGIIGLNYSTQKLQSLTVLAQETITVTKIDHITQEISPNSIYLTGEVTEIAPLLGQGAYALRDQSGIIWVLTEQNLPNIGEIVLIQGEIQYQSIPVDGQDIGEFYIKQTQNLALNQYIVAIAEDTTVVETPITPTPEETAVVPTPVTPTPEETAVTPTADNIIIENPQPRKLPFEPQFMPHK